MHFYAIKKQLVNKISIASAMEVLKNIYILLLAIPGVSNSNDSMNQALNYKSFEGCNTQYKTNIHYYTLKPQ